ncbi:1115_t:CDS:2, partial [Acaulospora morrowiae]
SATSSVDIWIGGKSKKYSGEKEKQASSSSVIVNWYLATIKVVIYDWLGSKIRLIKFDPFFQQVIDQANKNIINNGEEDNDMLSVNLRYYKFHNRNVTFMFEISKDKTVSMLEEVVRNRISLHFPINPLPYNFYLQQIYPENQIKPIEVEDRIFSYFNENLSKNFIYIIVQFSLNS